MLQRVMDYVFYFSFDFSFKIQFFQLPIFREKLNDFDDIF